MLCAALVAACIGTGAAAQDAFTPGLPGMDDPEFERIFHPALTGGPELFHQTRKFGIVLGAPEPRLGGVSLAMSIKDQFPVFYRAVDLDNTIAPWGCVRPIDDSKCDGIDFIGGDWTHQTWGSEDETLSYTISRLSPAVLVEYSGSGLGLFQDWVVPFYGHRPQWAYYRFIELAKTIAAEYGIKEPITEQWNIRPCFEFIAYPTDDGIAIDVRDDKISADEIQGAMTGNWCLIWMGRRSFFQTPTWPLFPFYGDIFGIQHKSEPGPEGGRWESPASYVQADCPFLVVFENRPEELMLTRDGLEIRAEKVGKIAFMPLLGLALPPVAETQKWREDGLPGDVVRKCRWWASKLAAIPVSVEENFRIDPLTGDVLVRNRFSYKKMDPEFDVEPVEYAPFPMMLGCAFGDGLALLGEAPGFFDFPGGYVVRNNTSEIQYAMRGCGKYVSERLALPDAKQLYAGLNEMLAREIEATLRHERLAPLHLAVTLSVHTGNSPAFSTPAQMSYALALALKAMPLDKSGKAREFMLRELGEFGPDKKTYLPLFEGDRRENYDIPPFEHALVEKQIHEYEKTERPPSYPNLMMSLYYLAECAALSGELDPAREKWDWLRQIFRETCASSDWASMLLLRQEGGIESAGGVQTANMLIAGGIGFARLAAMLGHEEDAAWGMYMTSKWLTARKALAKYVGTLYKAGICRVPPDVNYADRLHYGAITMVPDEWRCGGDDPRQIVWLDEFRARVSLANPFLGGEWTCPLLPFPLMNLVPETARFLRDECYDETLRYFRMFERSHPVWFATWAPKQTGGEYAFERPEVKRDMFMAEAIALERDFDTLFNHIDIPHCAADPDFIRNVMIAGWAEQGRNWKFETGN